jgi:hypothetical protein
MSERKRTGENENLKYFSTKIPVFFGIVIHFALIAFLRHRHDV